MDPLRHVTVIVLDSVGVGGAPDAARYGDEGSATLPHVAEAVGGLSLPHLESLGLGAVTEIRGVEVPDEPVGAYGSLTEISAGKDTTTGHWELMGVILEKPFPTYPDGFPEDLIARFEELTGENILGNEVASGTEIIARLGEEHMRTGEPIVYTSADSVFQIAAHVDVIPLPRLYELCEIARGMLRGEHEVGRVIARPFRGRPGAFERTPDRHDFSVLPPTDTVLDLIARAGLEVRAVGKISDIFAGRGVTSSVPTRSNDDGISRLIEEMRANPGGLTFVNLVDFDQAYGHRNDPHGYAAALEAFDARLPEICSALGPEDALFITADHGNDPTTPSTDHSRERTPVLVTGEKIAPVHLGIRGSFADLGATVLELLGIEPAISGSSFAPAILSR